MSCGGCNAKATDGMKAARAGMCRTCRHMPPDLGEATSCVMTSGGHPLKQLLQHARAECGAQRWPDANGIVTWRGRKWIGVPDPLRWVLAWHMGREPRVPGCGCDLELKASRLGRWIDPWAAMSVGLRSWAVRMLGGWRECRARIASGPG